MWGRQDQEAGMVGRDVGESVGVGWVRTSGHVWVCERDWRRP